MPSLRQHLSRLAGNAERSNRLHVEWLLFVSAALLFSAAAIFGQWFWRVDNTLYDQAIQKFYRPPPDDIVILAITDEDVSRIGQWPWPREIHVRAIDRLTEAGARGVLIDILFNEPDRHDPRLDQLLAQAIARNGRVVLPLIHESTTAGGREHLPIAVLAEAAAALGHVHSELDPDGIIRSTYLFEGQGEARWPHASLALLHLVDAQRFPLPGEAAPGDFKRNRSAWQRQNWFHIPFFGPPDHFKTYSYERWVTGEIPLEALRDKIVFIGTTATGLGDVYPTPASGFSRPMPGVEIAANVFEALRSGINLKTLSLSVTWAITAFLLLILFASYFRLRPGASIATTMIMLTVGYYSSRLLMYYGHLIITPATLLLIAVLAYPFWSWRRLATALRFLEQENTSLRRQFETAPVSESSPPGVFEPVSRSIEALRVTRERLEQANHERESFLNFLSHDMRSPQSSIIALIEMRRQGASRMSDDERYEKIEQYARKTSKLADEFVLLAKASQLMPSTLKPLELTSLIDEVADDAWPLASKRNIALLRRYHDEAFVLGQATLLSRAISNLLSNAIKFSPDNSEVTLAIVDDHDFWRVEVRDRGIGLSPSAQSRLLGIPEKSEPPSHSTSGPSPSPPSSQPHEAGLVLGLVLVRTVIERHGGSLRIDSALGHGSTFSFRLPKIHPPAA